jgi:hypothetical protein
MLWDCLSDLFLFTNLLGTSFSWVGSDSSCDPQS